MIVPLIIFVFLFLCLYVISVKIINQIFRLTNIEVLSFILLPGTIIHELSHMIISELLFVRTFRFSFKPTIVDNKVRIGSLEITQTDPFRKTMIGLAPIFVGISVLTAGYFFYLKKIFPHPEQILSFSLIQIVLLMLVLYGFFIISLTMFSSKKDLESSIIPFLIITFFGLIFYFLGFTINIKAETQQSIINFIVLLNKTLLTTLIINLFFLGILSLIARFFNLLK